MALGAGIVLVLCLMSAGARAQAPPGPIPPKPGVAIPKLPDQGAIRVKVEVVSAPVVVRDSQGEMVTDLEQKNFRIYDNGVEQTINHFDVGGDPLSIVLLVETSSRVASALPAIRKAGIVFSQSVMGQSGETAVIGVSGEVEMLQNFSPSHELVEDTLGRLADSGSQTRFKANGKPDTSGPQSRLYDALGAAVNMLRDRPSDHRRVIVAITEATDRGSTSTLGYVLRMAELENITIYTVGLSTAANQFRGPATDNGPVSSMPQGTFGTPPIPGEPQTPTTPGIGQQQGGDLLALGAWIIENGVNLKHGHDLEVATLATGGVHVPTFRDHSIEPALDRIGGELHAEYTLSYHPTDPTPGAFHAIKVLVDRPQTTVRTRPGYYLPLDQAEK